MSNLRAGPYSLKDPDDDAAFQELKTDVTELLIALRNPSPTIQKSYLLAGNNLSDLKSAAAARANLGISLSAVCFCVSDFTFSQSITESVTTTLIGGALYVLSNYQSAYSSSTGIFTCPLAGTWKFSGVGHINYTPNTFGVSNSVTVSVVLATGVGYSATSSIAITTTPLALTPSYSIPVEFTIPMAVGDTVKVQLVWADVAAGGTATACMDFNGNYLGT